MRHVHSCQAYPVGLCLSSDSMLAILSMARSCSERRPRLVKGSSREFNLLTVRPKGNRNLLSGMISGSTSPRTKVEEMTLQRLFLCREMPDRLIWRALLRWPFSSQRDDQEPSALQVAVLYAHPQRSSKAALSPDHCANLVIHAWRRPSLVTVFSLRLPSSGSHVWIAFPGREVWELVNMRTSGQALSPSLAIPTAQRRCG